MRSAIGIVKLATIILLTTAFALWMFGFVSFPIDRLNADEASRLVAAAGPWGPIVIIGLMIVAVVASPLPSAPIALAAGAAYGHYAGTLYVAAGSELGALAAFLIARILGRETVEKMLGDKVGYQLLGSQNFLTMTVFASRLLPFISFDAISYAAGLSRLFLWRFMIATLAGIMPASFILAHFGSEAASGSFGKAEWIAGALGLLTGIPLLLIALRSRDRHTQKTAPAQPNIQRRGEIES